MTIGPLFVLWALAERWTGPVSKIIETFGRVPMFYYLLHIPLIHLAACVVSLVREGHVDAWLFTNHPLTRVLFRRIHVESASPLPGLRGMSGAFVFPVQMVCRPKSQKTVESTELPVIARDKESCVVFGMPREANRYGAVDRVLPLSHIPAALPAESRRPVS